MYVSVCVCVCECVSVRVSVCVSVFLYAWRHKISGFVSTPVIGWIESWLSMLACVQRYRNGRPGSDIRFLVEVLCKGCEGTKPLYII